MEIRDLERKACQVRRGLLDMIYKSQVGHIGGALSSADIITALFYRLMRFDPQNPQWEDRDRFILSKGHCVEGYYFILADLGFFDKAELSTFCQFGTRLIAHPNRKIPGVEMNTGSLGHGLAVACGMALAGKMDHKDYRVYALMGDGEQDEGSVWEAAMLAANYKLDNLCVIVDRNRLQISGKTEEIMCLEPFAEKWRAFGFHVEEIDGNDMSTVVETLERLKDQKGKPKMILANTVKGKGICFMENQVKWHHGAPDKEGYTEAVTGLDQLAKELCAND